jgi:hypothetical protein
MRLDLPSIHAKALLAFALSLAASCLSLSVTSLGSAKLNVDSAGDGMAEEGGVEEERDAEDDSLMFTILSVSVLANSICTHFQPVRPNIHTEVYLPPSEIDM